MRIAVAMSGGVDSSVVAGLMAEAGHEVVGVTLQLYDHGAATGRKGACCAGQDIHDARRVADGLGIAHYVIDMEARFRAAVIEDFADAYARGETPLPCARCNATVKFADLLGIARDLGAEALATGHYVRRIEGASGPELHVAADARRDQSYFLYALTAGQLAFCRFPLGDRPDKDAVRAEADRLRIPVATKPDSQDLCFVPQGSYAELVGKLRPEAMASGEIVDEAGRVVGTHAGIARFTVGQGRGLGPASVVDGARMQVVRLDAARRRVVVGPRGAAGRARVALRDVNWLGDAVAAVKLRARETPQPARAERLPGGGALVHLAQPSLAAPGQACVFYAGSRVLGGGTIAAEVAAADAA
jgi:tRNA-specific 2-thiouridylase